MQLKFKCESLNSYNDVDKEYCISRSNVVSIDRGAPKGGSAARQPPPPQTRKTEI
jgi:hypothetical protein